jgi:hypothetical protein
MKRLMVIVLGALALGLVAAASAAAAVSLEISEAQHSPATINRGDEFVSYSVKVKNTGDQATTAATNVSVALPVGVKLSAASGSGWSCDTATGVCSSSATIAPSAQFPTLTLKAWIYPDQAPDTVVATFAAAGGGGGTEANASEIFSFGPATPFGLTSLSASAEDEAGADYTLAGGHPFSASSSFDMALHTSPTGELAPVQSLRDLFFDLPPGLVGNPQSIPAVCSVREVSETDINKLLCPESAAVGGVGIDLGGFSEQERPLYRIVPEAGYVAAFAFRALKESQITVVIRAKIRSNGDYGVTAVAPLPPQYPEILRARFVTLCSYGVKAPMGSFVPEFKGCRTPGQAGSNSVPFLTNPTSCTGEEPVTKVTVDSFEHPGTQTAEGFPDLSDPNWKVKEAGSPPITGCNQLEFDPSFEGRPTTNVADAPSGLDFNLHIPQEGLVDPDGLGSAHLKNTAVLLPEGMAVNPAAATGLQACSSAQIGLTTAIGASPVHFSGFPANCPAASKLGTVEVSTPLLDKPLKGSVYLAKQYDNPFNSLLALYLAVADPETGVVVKLAGKVTPDPVSGQLRTSFDENPQVPFEDLKLSIFEGPRASLRTPPTCGPKATTAVFTPWSAPESGPPAERSDGFQTTTAPGGGPCPTTLAALPNAPRFSAGTLTPKAGAYSPFVLRLARDDGSQELKGLSATLPPGLTGRLAGLAQCSEARIAVAKGRSRPGEGATEQAAPSCPAASELGSVDVAAGAGPLPYHATGKAYLAGPYKGAPVSLVVITPAVAGPFDLGTVVVRNALHVNPVTTQVSVLSDPIPTILEGIPLDVRSIEVSVTRNQFTLNPTSCEPMAIAATAFGQSSNALLSSRFQVGECEALPFKPKLSLRLEGGTKRGAYQRLTATVTAKPGEANIARAAVTLPHSSFLAQEHIRTVCTRVQFAAKACPAGSVYGSATAITPLLDEPIQGPVYLRSNPEHELPDLVAALRGPDSMPIEVELSGRTDSKNGGIRNTFDFVPDAPVTKFTLQLRGGKKSLIVNSRDLCKGTQKATVRLAAHNGKTHDFRPVVGNDCGKGRKGKALRRRASLQRLLEAW